MDLWVPDHPERDALGSLPGGVSLGFIPPRGDLPAGLVDAEFLVAEWGIPGLLELVPRMSALRVIQTMSAGVDWLLPVAPTGVTVCDAAGARDAAVAEWVLAVILAVTRSLGELRDLQREHVWRWRRSKELCGQTALILGYGSIGTAVEARLAPFGVDIIRVARHARPGVHADADLDSLLPRADIVVVLLPLTPATSGVIDAAALARMRDGALLVNAARGPIVDTDALLGALQAGRLKAALDVTDPEPLPPNHPLWTAPGVLITPHFAGDTEGGERRAYALAGDQVRRYVGGEALVNVVADGY